jgi:hypothetical protein
MEPNPYEAPQHLSDGIQGRPSKLGRWIRLLCVAFVVSAAILAGYKIVEVLLIGF